MISTGGQLRLILAGKPYPPPSGGRQTLLGGLWVGIIVLSWQATAWAIEQREIEDPLTLLVLLCMANYAGEDGANCFPSIRTLAFNSRLSERTVQRHIAKLVEVGLIQRGNQKIAMALIQRSDRRPVVYDLMIPRGVTQSPRSTDGVSHKASRGVTKRERGDTAESPDPPSRSSKEHKSVEKRKSWEEEYRDRFGCLPSGLAKRVPR